MDAPVLVESANTVHGRLLEAVHISGYTFERACSELEWLLDEDRWKSVGGGFGDINAFLATIDLSDFRIAVEQRRKLAQRLKEIEASQRATAKMLGVGEATVRRDLGNRDAPNGAPAEVQTHENGASGKPNAPNGAPAWFQDDADPSQLAKSRERSAKKREERLAAVADLQERNPSLPPSERKYGVIYADPPWSFQVWSGEGKDRAAENHYPTMTQEAMEALPVASLAADDCALFMWAVMPQLPEALAVIRAWGFEYKTCAFVWVKQTNDGERFATGMGYWTRANAEVCLLATRGSPVRLNADVHQVILAPREEHSRKPAEAASRIERLVAGPYIELFAREVREGWTVWGNQAEGAK